MSEHKFHSKDDYYLSKIKALRARVEEFEEANAKLAGINAAYINQLAEKDVEIERLAARVQELEECIRDIIDTSVQEHMTSDDRQREIMSEALDEAENLVNAREDKE